MTYKQVIKAVILLISLSMLFVVVVISGYLLFENKLENNAEIGIVRVRAEVYFDGVLYTATESSELKVVEINISNIDEPNYFNKFSVKIFVESSVDTYFRVAVYEQFTLSYYVGDEKIVIAVTQDEYAPFSYNNMFYNNRLEDDYFYYKNKVKRNGVGSPLVLNFINEYQNSYPLYDARYSINIGLVIDAVQALNGPQINWNMARPPWDTDGTLNW